MKTKHLVIIPGLGDRVHLYRLVRPLWNRLGYETHVFSFEWESKSEDFEHAQQRMTAFIHELASDQVYIIGASAGGTAAINAALLQPDRIRRVVTIATPYAMPKKLKNKKLSTSINRMSSMLDKDAASVILSLHGLYDGVVPIKLSRAPHVRTRTIYALGHGLSIVTAVTLRCMVIRRFFNGTTRH